MRIQQVVATFLLWSSSFEKVRGAATDPARAPEAAEAMDLFRSTRIVHNVRKRRDASSEEDHQSLKNRLIIALQYVAEVESRLRNRTGCSEVAALNISFDRSRWKKEAMVTVQAANLLTALWRVKGQDGFSIASNATFLFNLARANVMSSPAIFGSVVCFAPNQYRNYARFCPYAYRDKTRGGKLHVFDIAAVDNYDYATDANAIWWSDIANKISKLNATVQTTDYFTMSRREEEGRSRSINVTLPLVAFDDGVWTRPYFDCFGGKVWMVTYLAPIFNETNEFLGAVSIDVILSHIDINQCDPYSSSDVRTNGEETGDQLKAFLGTHRCKASTKCVPVPGQGFKRGSYVCECRRGYYFPSPDSTVKAFNGSVVESEYDKLLREVPNLYEHRFECMRCSRGCTECVDDSPCVFTEFKGLWLGLLVITGVCVVIALGFAVSVFLNWKNKIFKASSPRFLELTILGTLLMYLKVIVMFLKPTSTLCMLQLSVYHVGFALAYGSLALKTWRISMIFRVRSAQRIFLTDMLLFRRLVAITLSYVGFLAVWAVTQPPQLEVATTVSGLKYTRCTVTWCNAVVIAGDISLLVWGMWLSNRVRKVPPAYNESKYIAIAIYCTMFATCLSTFGYKIYCKKPLEHLTSQVILARKVLKEMNPKGLQCLVEALLASVKKTEIAIRNYTNPDITYASEVSAIHVTATLMLGLLGAHKFLLSRALRRTAQDAPSQICDISFSRPTDGSQLNIDEIPLERRHQELQDEVQRLATRVATLQSRLMSQQNCHIRKKRTVTTSYSSGLGTNERHSSDWRELTL